jgi:hypothetical protein
MNAFNMINVIARSPKGATWQSAFRRDCFVLAIICKIEGKYSAGFQYIINEIQAPSARLAMTGCLGVALKDGVAFPYEKMSVLF